MELNKPVDITKLAGIVEGDHLRLTVWLKGANLVPDSAALYPGTWSVGLTPLWFAKGGNNDGYDVIQANDFTWQFPAVTSFDWAPYTLDVTVPAGAKVLEVRLHTYSRFTGTIYWDDVTIEVIGTTTAVRDPNAEVPAVYELGQNYPNPFNPSTTISYGVPRNGEVTLVVYDMLGRQVRELARGYASAGRYTVTWDGHDDQGHAVGSGMYLYRLTAGDHAMVNKMVFVK
jgi:hypothetical protein